MSSVSLKKKKLAPLKKSSQGGSVLTEQNPIVNCFEFDDDVLNDIFPQENEKSEKATSADSNSFIDLDDWMPDESLPTGEDEEQKPSPGPVKKSSSKNSTQVKEKPAIRNLGLFTSKEFECDSTVNFRFLVRHMPASTLKDLSVSSKKVELIDSLSYGSKDNWFIAGVVADYSEFKGSTGARIDVTDLSSEPYILRVLLFKSAFSEIGKIPLGTILCVKNPAKGKPYNGKEALLANDSNQILLAGTSRDYGLCSGRTKSGSSCRAVVNMNICRYCRFHAVSEYKNQKMARDIRAAAAGVGLRDAKKGPVGLWNAKANLAPSLTPATLNKAKVKKDQGILDRLNDSNDAGPDEKPFWSPVSRTPESIPHKRKFELTPPGPSSPRLSAAKRRALEYVRQKGSVEVTKARPVWEPKKEEETKRPKGITEEFLAAMKAKPLNPSLLKAAEAAEQNKRFERLQIVEEIGEKMATTHQVPVRAIRCLICQKNFHAMPLQCVMNKHSCKVVTGTKRFFECGNCKNRTTTLEILPLTECGKCGAAKWKKAGVAPDKVCSISQPLSVRGLEEKFIGSTAKDPNLNLLVPEQS